MTSKQAERFQGFSDHREILGNRKYDEQQNITVQ